VPQLAVICCLLLEFKVSDIQTLMDFVSEVLIDREQRGVDAGFHQHVEKLIDWLIVLKL
jgi:hypothetical protein